MTLSSQSIADAPHSGSSGGWTPDYPQKTAKGKEGVSFSLFYSFFASSRFLATHA